MIPKQDLLELIQKEFATTARTLRAYPPGQDGFRPHERSSDVIRLASTFVFEMRLLQIYLFGDEIDRAYFKTYRPETVQSAAAEFEKLSTETTARFAELPESQLGKTVEFGGRSFTADKFTAMMVHDQIHHRGQLSVYIRMAGGKVPAIYGPSADDASTNL